MRRRGFVQAIPFVCASPALFAQAMAQLDTKLATSTPDSAGDAVPGFFSAPQFAALRRLSDILLPSIDGAPGALDAKAPEFLDFLIGQSPLPTRRVYLNGLDSLNSRAKTQPGGSLFAALDEAQAEALLTPLLDPWTWQEPADPFALFLRHAKADVLTATTNSREWISAAQRRGGSGGNGTYWPAPE